MIMNDIINVLKSSSNIAVACHVSMDGDSVGCVLGLTYGLRSIGKNVKILSKEDVPDNLRFLTGTDEINQKNSVPDEDVDCLVVLDCGNVERINADLNFESRKYIVINIDHHLSNDVYGNYNYVNSNAAAAGEIVYQLLMMMGINITKPVAEALYTAIITDTGMFKYSSTTSITHSIAGYLINCGIDFSEIYRKIYENKKFERIKFYGGIIDNIRLECNGKLAIIKITDDLLDKYHASDKDTSDVLPFASQIDSVDVTLLIKEHKNGVKVSLRSKNIVDVRKVAEIFGGGGHTRASGITMDKNIDEAEKAIVDELEKYLM